MRKGIALFTLLALVLTSAALATTDISRAPIRNIKFIGTESDPPPPAGVPVGMQRVPRNNLDMIGVNYQAGTTWYDYQHNGTTGKMIDVDNSGWVHLVWMNGLNESTSSRHVYYNLWDPTTESYVWQVDPNWGQQIDGASRAGYISQTTTDDGSCFPVFHQVTPADVEAHTAASIDVLPQSGAFSAFEPTSLWDAEESDWMEIIWPHVSQGIDGDLHVVSSENPLNGEAGDPQKIYYSRGVPIYEGGWGTSIEWQQVSGEDEFLMLDTVMVIAVDVAASRYTDKVVVAWAESRDNLAIPDSATQRNNDIVYIVSEDGGETWSAPTNITNFEYPDLECASGDTLECDRDTFRVYTDLSLILDESDQIHIAFTTSCYWSLEGTISRYASQIWCWNEADEEISPIHALAPDYFTANWALEIGDWQYILQRPNLCVDPISGYLYCSFQHHDTLQWSELGIPQADAWVAVSTDCGRSWSAGTNVTETVADDGGQGTPAGQNAHERDITLSEVVTYEDGVGYLHMEYVFDLDAGGAVGENPTGVPTLNPVYYQRIPIAEIPAEPRWDHTWPQIHVDGTQVPYGGEPNPTFDGPCTVSIDGDTDLASLPGKFMLHQNYPNPFNPSTQIQFDLANSMNVTLKVFNVLGQEVQTLLNHKQLGAGVQVVEFDATDLPSGVYVYQLEANGISQSRKMVLLK